MTAELRAALAQEGGTLAEAVVLDPAGPERDPGADHPPRVAAAGPRASSRPQEYELLLEMIFEGSLLHYGAPRVVESPDPDLALLLGDQLYALGLSRLAALGDVNAVAELGDLISLVAQAQAARDPALASAAWQGAAVAIGWGATPAHEAAKALARAGDATAAHALRAAAAAVLEGSGGPGS